MLYQEEEDDKSLETLNREDIDLNLNNKFTRILLCFSWSPLLNDYAHSQHPLLSLAEDGI